MKTILALVAVSLLAGCARGHWEYPGPAAEANKLAYDCQYMANMQAKGTGGAAPYIANRQFRDCMQSRGFVWVDETQRRATAETERNANKTAQVSELNFSSETLIAAKNLPTVSIDSVSRKEKMKLLASIEAFNTCNKEFLEGFEENPLPKPKSRTKNIVTYEANDKFVSKKAIDIYEIMFALGAHEKCSLHTDGDVRFIHNGSEFSSINTANGKATIVSK